MLRLRACQEIGKGLEIMAPEKREAAVLRIDQVVQLINTCQYGGWNDLSASKIFPPGARLHRRIVIEALDGIEIGVRNFTLNRHEPVVPETEYDVRLASGFWLSKRALS